jgi:hypothetical protein
LLLTIFHFHFFNCNWSSSISSITTNNLISSIAIAFLLLCCTVFYLGVCFFAFSSTWKKYDFHTYKKRIGSIPQISKKSFFARFLLQVPAGSKKIKRILKIFYFHNNNMVYSQIWLNLVCGMTPVWLHAKNWGRKKSTHWKLLQHIIIINLKINTIYYHNNNI